MSRIHEALKKAEQERLSALTVPTPATPSDAAQSRPAPELSSPAAPAQAPGLRTAAARDLAPALTLETLRGICRQPGWKPDPATMIFSGSQQEHRLGSEEFRTLRSRLYQLRDRQPLRTLLVTSALPAEGKTFVSANLAQVIARQHERSALLIDGDLRWSRLHLSLGAPSSPGLSEYLRGQADEISVIQRGPQENLFFIAGGQPVSNPAELIHGDRLKDLLTRMSKIFDWVILDSPPAVPVSDASMLADLCDGVLLVVHAASTPYDLAQKVRQEFSEKRLLGAVLNRMGPGTGYSSYYYDHYGYTGKNGKGRS